MGEVEGKRGTGGAGGPEQAGATGRRAAPGKTTRTAAIQRKAARGAGGVEQTARAEVAGAFGERAEGIGYGEGGGAAEEHDANAVTVAGQVDFAPGQFDVDSDAGRARLGEETAHAIQQSNPGAPAGVDALEDEAKQAGRDFADGREPQVDLAASPDQALADGPKDTDPSTEVPDLLHGEVVAIKKVLKSDRAKALALLLKALQRIDATTFASTDLEGGKLHAGGSSYTRQGAKFVAWLETALTAHATKLKKKRADLTEAEVKTAAAAVPADKKDIRVSIGSGHFASASLLYSTVRHEFVHVAQHRANYLEHIPSSVMPDGAGGVGSIAIQQEREIEAYFWEMDNLAKTGLTDAGELYLLWDKSSDAWNNISGAAQTKWKARYGPAFNAVWKKAMDGHIAAIGEHYKTFKKTGTVPDADTVVYTLQVHMKMMWRYRNNFGNKWSSTEAAYDAALKQSEEILGNGKEAEFKKAIDKADADLKAGITDAWTAYSTWWNLLNKWINLDAAQVKSYQARWNTTASSLWKQAFTLYEAKINAKLKSGDAEEADTLLFEKIGTLYRYASKSNIKTADFDARKKALDDAVKKAKKP